MFSNIQNSNMNFTGYYYCDLNKLSSEAKNLTEAGTDVIHKAAEILEKMQKINCGNYTISNYEKPKVIKPVLAANVGSDEVVMSPYLDGFHLAVNKGARDENVDVISVWGGDTIEFESSQFPLKANEYKELNGHVLVNVESLIKKYMPVFINK